MTETPIPNEVLNPEKKASKFPRWLLIVIPIAIIGVCVIAALVGTSPFFFNLEVSSGGYSIESVTLSSGMKNGQPVGVKDVFMPSDTINCTVKTSGIKDGIIGMRWFLGDEKIYEAAGKTQDNIISMYIRSNKSAIIPEGKYRVEIFMTDKPLETVHFEVKIYHPTVHPTISIPQGHKKIEAPWFPEVPFAFDETWKIGNTEWKVNEVKVVLMGDTKEYFVAVVIDTDMNDIMSLDESTAKERTREIALYALENGYIEKGKSLEIDGQHFDLNQSVFVILKNPARGDIYRVQFKMDELK